jgi:2,4-dienoyl-CoA reductase-like NADH-dependent reductase (Old Yellow Enzyme family)
MSLDSHLLFQPFELKDLRLSNRIVMAPMTRCRAGISDVPTPLMAEYYSQRASAGLIITEGAPISPSARGYLWTPGIYLPEQIKGWKNIATSVHAAGGIIFTQIWHTGRISHVSLQPNGIAPCGATNVTAVGSTCFAYGDNGQPGYVATSQPSSLTAAGITEVIQQFAQAAHNARSANLDGVEIHAANGYLIDQFINSQINTRNDEYGGTTENRARFLINIVDAVAARIGANRIGVRISPYGQFNSMPEDTEVVDTMLYVAQTLNQRGIAYLHVNDQRTFGYPSIPEEFLRQLRQTFNGTLIVCGGYDLARAVHAIDNNLADLIGFGIPFIANPDLPARLQHGWRLNEPNRNSFYGGGAWGYTDYPRYQLP